MVNRQAAIWNLFASEKADVVWILNIKVLLELRQASSSHGLSVGSPDLLRNARRVVELLQLLRPAVVNQIEEDVRVLSNQFRLVDY